MVCHVVGENAVFIRIKSAYISSIESTKFDLFLYNWLFVMIFIVVLE